MLKESKTNFERNFNDILQPTFILMKFCGLWNPFHNSLLRILYIFYSILIMLLRFTVGLAVICLLIFASENNKEIIVKNSFLLITLLNGWVKAIILFSRHQDIQSLLNVLLEDQCLPQDIIELEIQRKSDEEAKYDQNYFNKNEIF